MRIGTKKNGPYPREENKYGIRINVSIVPIIVGVLELVNTVIDKRWTVNLGEPTALLILLKIAKRVMEI